MDGPWKEEIKICRNEVDLPWGRSIMGTGGGILNKSSS
jgi:hypothetical protein